MDDPEAWRSQAACRGAPIDWFYPERGGTLHEARRLCRSCPVSDDCLTYAMTMEDTCRRFGLWGNRTSKQRRQMNPTPYQPIEHERSA
jgi:WhiB family redox-sensing transcriptional regulator